MLSIVVSGQNFAIITDLHVIPGNENDSALQTIVEQINASDNQFVIITGDLTNQGSDWELKRVHEILDKLTIPYHIISGNHETTWSESGCLTYNELWGQDRFAFTDDRFLYIGFPCGPYMKMGDGFIKYEDILWVEQTIREKLQPSMQVIAFAHYPLDESVSNFTQMTSLLKANRTAVSFCGHGHDIRLLNFNSIPGIMARSITSRDGFSRGFNEVRIKGDSLILREMTISAPSVNRISISLTSNDLSKIKSSLEQTPIAESKIAKLFKQDNASIFNGIEITGSTIISANSLGAIKAYDISTGNQIWSRVLNNSIYSHPITVGKIVIIGTIDGQLLGLDLKSGLQKWTIKSPRIFVGKPTVEQGDIYVASSSEFLKIEAATGRVIWRTALPKSYSQGAPTIAGDKVLFGVWDTNLYCLNKDNGSLIWKWNNGKTAELLSPGNVKSQVIGNTVYLVAPDRYMTAIDLNTGRTLWRDNSYKVRESMGISTDGKTIYAKTMDGELLAVRANDKQFEKLWLLDTGLGYEHNPCPIVEFNGVIYLGSRKGEVVLVDAITGKMVAKEKIGNSSVNSFTIDSAQEMVWCSLIEGSIFKLQTNPITI